MTEADLYSILLSFAELYTSTFEFFIAGTLAMVVAIFIYGAKLNLYLRTFSILVYSGFCLSTYQIMSVHSLRMNEVIKSISVVTSIQLERLPVTSSLLERSLVSVGNWQLSIQNYIILLAW